MIHCGSGPNRGHYISIVKSHGFWLLFDDDQVDVSIFTVLCYLKLHDNMKQHACMRIFNINIKCEESYMRTRCDDKVL